MEVCSKLHSAAHRLGLELSTAESRLVVQRRGWTVTADIAEPTGSQAFSVQLFRTAWICLAIRLGIDKHLEDAQSEVDTPMRFRRAPVRRYHEAPSVHGDILPLLVPRLTRLTFEQVSNRQAFFRPWRQPDLELLFVRETGLRLDILTTDEQRRSDLSDEQRWQKARSALFYQSYKVRPLQVRQVKGGALRVFETSEGFGASRAVLLPEYDYDASRDYGYLAVPSRDRIIIARPTDRSDAPRMLPAMRQLAAHTLHKTPFGLSDAIFQLEPNDLVCLDEPTFRLGDDESKPPIIDVEPP